MWNYNTTREKVEIESLPSWLIMHRACEVSIRSPSIKPTLSFLGNRTCPTTGKFIWWGSDGAGMLWTEVNPRSMGTTCLLGVEMPPSKTFQPDFSLPPPNTHLWLQMESSPGLHLTKIPPWPRNIQRTWKLSYPNRLNLAPRSLCWRVPAAGAKWRKPKPRSRHTILLPRRLKEWEESCVQ